MRETGSGLVRPIPVPGLWCVLAYYTTCHYAPDGSRRVLLAGVDLESGIGEVLILSRNGEILDRFSKHQVTPAFFHSGFRQTWGYDGRSVYYQYHEGGHLDRPRLVRRRLRTGHESVVEAETENMPPAGAPILSGLHSLMFAAEQHLARGDAGGVDTGVIPIQARDRHGLFEFSFEPPVRRLRLSVAEVLAWHPHRDELLNAEQRAMRIPGIADGLTLMIYAVRWNRTGTRLLFYFGNHNMDRERGEPRIGYVITADRDLEELHLAVDLSFGRGGNHWAWHPDGEHVIGNSPDPDNEGQVCLAQVRYDGSDYRRLSRYAVVGGLVGADEVDSLDTGGGHPSVSHRDYDLLVTDTYGDPGEVAFIDLRTDCVVQHHALPRVARRLPGRHWYRVDHHPSFSRDGSTVLVNTLPGTEAVVCEIGAPRLHC